MNMGPTEPVDAAQPASPWRLRAQALGILVLILLGLQLGASTMVWLRDTVINPLGLPAFVNHCLYAYLHLPLLAGVLTLVERALPGSATPRLYGRAMLFWAFYIPVAVLSAELVQRLVAWTGFKPLLQLRFSEFGLTGLPGVALNAGLILLGAILLDFFYYWFHRLQHAVPFLWAFHSVHHANRSLNAVSCYHHALEDVLRIPFFMLPMALAFQVDTPQLVLLSSFVTAWGFFNHLDSSFNLAWARPLFADNHYHRVHHSLAREHFDTNFAGIFSGWDRLFGTQVMPPANAATLPVGLDDVASPVSVRDFLWMPARVLASQRRPAEPGTG